MIWVEILSRQRDVVARFRIAGPEARIGRGYDNDVVVDDPYVAAHHLRVFRDDTGQLVAEDMNSANGTFLDGSKNRVAHIVVDGKRPIRIGQTLLRVRDKDHVVERERMAGSEQGVLPIVAIAALGLAVLGIDALKIWLTQTSEPRASSYLTPLLAITAIVLAWTGVWALLSRVFSGHSRFLSNLLIAVVGILAFSIYAELAQFAAFAWTWPTASIYQYVVVWLILATVCFLHLREVGSARLLFKGALVAVLLVVAIAVQTLQRSEAFSDSGRQTTERLLMPPALRLVSLSDKGSFFGEIAKLKAKLDSDRTRARNDEAYRQKGE